MVKIPSFFHELFGEKQRMVELVATILFAVMASTFIYLHYGCALAQLSILSQVIMIMLILDITGGAIANLTLGTDQFYAKNRKARLLFIAVHVQPLLIFWLAAQPLWIGFLLWAYTIMCALVLEAFKNHPSHKVGGGWCLCIGIGLVFSFQATVTPYVLLLMFLYMFKVIFSFSLNHYLGNEYESQL